MASTTTPASTDLQHVPVQAVEHEKGHPRTPASEDGKEMVIMMDEATRPPSLQNEAGVAVRTPAQRRKVLMQFFALCSAIYVAGWNDGTTGPLLPRIQVVYNVSASTRVFEWMTLTVRCCWCECR